MINAKNFICISSFNDDLDWFKEFDYPHIIYDKCYKGIKKSKYYPYEIKPSNLCKKYHLLYSNIFQILSSLYLSIILKFLFL